MVLPPSGYLPPSPALTEPSFAPDPGSPGGAGAAMSANPWPSPGGVEDEHAGAGIFGYGTIAGFVQPEAGSQPALAPLPTQHPGLMPAATLHPYPHAHPLASTQGYGLGYEYGPGFEHPHEADRARGEAAWREAQAYASKARRDMNMAPEGSTASKAGSQTPLAAYTAQMVVWLWYGRHTPPPPQQATPPPRGWARSVASSTQMRNPFSPPLGPVNPLQLAPTAEFTHFVSRILKTTGVSHSVTLISLLYIHRLTSRYSIDPGPGTEIRPFVASLLLANKYLDDNTYTNRTWGELAGLKTAEINKMEHEFLHGLEYRLSVDKREYTQWRLLLDGFIVSRHYESNRVRPAPDLSASPHSATLLSTPHSAILGSQPYIDPGIAYRSRSESPGQNSPPIGHDRYLSPGSAKKRSAGDAFANDPMAPAGVYESMRLPARKAQAVFTPLHQPPHPDSQPTLFHSASNASLGRSSSFNRRIARLPISAHGDPAARRGSAGNIYAAANPYGQGYSETDLRHAATQQAAAQRIPPPVGQDQYVLPYSGTVTPFAFGQGQEQKPYVLNSLVAPCDQRMEAHNIPPEHLQFYTITAASHPGHDGAPRKAILRHQEAPPHHHPYSYPPHTAYAPQSAIPYAALPHEMMDDAGVSPTYVSHLQPPYVPTPHRYGPPAHDVASYPEYIMSSRRATPVLPPPHTGPEHPYYGAGAAPEPGVFANNGPPGWTYEPALHHTMSQNPNRWSTGSDEMMYYGDHSRMLSGSGGYGIEMADPASAVTYAPLAHPAINSLVVAPGTESEMVPYYPPPASVSYLPPHAHARQQSHSDEWRSRSEWSSPARGPEGKWFH